MKIQYCKKCLMPNTRPGSIFDKQGICQACHNYEKRKMINWKEREKELDALCDKYRGTGYYDCLIPVSGGKDSHRAVYEIKTKRKMNPLLVTVGDPFTKTKAGLHNLRNLGDTFGCDSIIFNASVDLIRKATRLTFEESGEPLVFLELAIYTVPIKMAVSLKIPFMIYGEYAPYEYGTTDKQTYSALGFINNSFKNADIDFWLKRGFSRKELNCVIPPTKKEFASINPEPVFLSYFIPWNSIENFKLARRHGFRDVAQEWKREGCVEDFDQIDSIGYMVHHWLKYPKFGFQRASELAARHIREERFGLERAKKLIKEKDHKLDSKSMKDFISVLGYTPKQFWNITGRFWNPNLFEKIDGAWKPKFNYDE